MHHLLSLHRTLYYEFCWLSVCNTQKCIDRAGSGDILPVAYDSGWAQAVRWNNWKAIRGLKQSIFLINKNDGQIESRRCGLDNGAHPDVCSFFFSFLSFFLCLVRQSVSRTPSICTTWIQTWASDTMSTFRTLTSWPPCARFFSASTHPTRTGRVPMPPRRTRAAVTASRPAAAAAAALGQTRRKSKVASGVFM